MRWYRRAQAEGDQGPVDDAEVDVVQSEPGEKARPQPTPQQQQMVKKPIDRNRMPLELQNRMRGVVPGPIMNRNKGVMNSPDFYRLWQDLGTAHWFGTSNPRKMENRLNKPEPLPPTKNDPKKPLQQLKPQPPQPTKSTSPNAKQPGPVAPAWQGKQVQPTKGKKAGWVGSNCRFASQAKKKEYLDPDERLQVKERFGKTECSFARDEDGCYCYTHRARSKSYDAIGDIPKDVVEFIGSTG
jgi:hypothetical protein